VAELIVELLCEEIPARMQDRARAEFEEHLTKGLKEAGLEATGVESFATPRRLAVCIQNVPLKQADIHEERRGPRVGAPDQAIAGFLRSVGLNSIDDCDVREVKGGTFYFAVIDQPGGDTADALPEIVGDAIRKLSWPKSMRWGSGHFAFVRPLHNILCIFNSWPVTGEIDLGGGVALPFSPKTVGHRFLAPGDLLVDTIANYKDRLKKAFVLLDHVERRETIWSGAAALARKRGLTLQEDPGLLNEVTGLVEWPVPLLGTIDEGFMDLPQEVLITSMRSHQKYFAVYTRDGHMAPRFIVIANITSQDDGQAILAGNERVLRARLSDAKFFWDQDRQRRLEENLPALSEITFHAQLGNVGERARRLSRLASEIGALIEGADRQACARAGLLAKADLVTGMVGEFPELQGTMGRYYALNDGEEPTVADAIAAHYSPQGPGDKCPTEGVSVSVALADKLDLLVGFFSIEEKPTGSRDPYGLRRAALGIIRIILENRLRLPLIKLIEASFKLYSFRRTRLPREVLGDLLDFFADRLKVHLREQGVRHDLINAVFALKDEDDLIRIMKRVDALDEFVNSDDGINLLTAYRRAANIVKGEERKDGRAFAALEKPGQLNLPEELSLFRALEGARTRAVMHLNEEDFRAVMKTFSGLREPIDTFFEKVKVNVDAPRKRERRLRLLATFSKHLDDYVADFSKIEG
jgi:glycyl-tRNA synthetase beta chain